MAFPNDALYARTELYHKFTDAGVEFAGWRDITSDVYHRDLIKVGRGRNDEAADAEPTTVELTLNNRTGKYSPRNPSSDLYGKIGRNTPIRVTVGTEPAQQDTFTRTTSNGWGGTGALAWTLAGGTVPDDYDVTGAEATHTHPSASVLHHSTVDSGETDGRVRVIFDTDTADITGANVSVWAIARMTDTSNYYALVTSYGTNEVLTFRLHKRVGGVLTSLGSGSITVASSGNPATLDYIGEIYVEGNWVHGKVWRRFATDEPIAWQQSVEDTEDQPPSTGTLVGVASRRETGNTNANWQARFLDFLSVPGTLRATAEVSSWPPRWDVSGNDVYTPIQAAGVLRRLEQGARPLRSALWRENLFGGAVAFWPIIDGENAPYAASALPGGAPLSIISLDWDLVPVPLDWSPVSYNEWLEPVATPALDTQLTFTGPTSLPSTATEWAVDWVFTMTSDSTPLGGTVVILRSALTEWIVLIGPDNEWQVAFTDREPIPDDIFQDFGAAPVAANDGRVHHARLTATQDGADIDWELRIDNFVATSGTLTGWTWEPPTDFQGATGTKDAGQTSMGFVVIWDTASPPFNAANAAVVGRSGETAGARLIRLLGEENIPFQLIGDEADTEAMGPQLLATLVANLRDCEDVDMGVLYEPRHALGLAYRTRTSLYNQTPRVELDYTTEGHVSPPLEPVEDDQRTRNDITVNRPRGSSARAVRDTGPLNVSQPWEDPDGVGVYDESVSVNCDLDDQLAPIAQWKLHKGTWDEARYRQLRVNLRAAAAIYAAISHLDVGDVATIDNTPGWLPAELVRLIAEGYSETIGLYDWEIVFNTSPAGIYTVGIFDDAGSRYDSAYSTTSGAITTGTNTSLSVAVEAGRSLWSTTAAPFDIDLLGARVQVTAVSGASSPQTFTISATVVNGINKAIPSGTPVRLWDPARYAM